MSLATPRDPHSPRPTSSQSMRSKVAWQDQNELYAYDPEMSKTAPNPFGDGDAPVAMESEVFDKDGSVRVNQRHDRDKEPKGCWQKFRHGIRSIWMTKETEDTRHDRELYIKTTLRELIIYIFFLTILCIITFGMTSTTMYYYTQVLNELFLDANVNTDAGPQTFKTISRMDHIWAFLSGALLDGLYWEQWYNGQNITDDERGFIYFENKLLGLPRMRMVKVTNTSCVVPTAFSREIKECFDEYSEGAEDRMPFGPMNGTAWTYHSDKSLDTGSTWGQISTYGGGGFYQDFAITREETAPMIDFLMNNLWITRGTRAVIIDFTVYNANINLFCIIELIMELPATGGVITSWSFRTLKLIRYVTAFDFFILACEGIFCVFIIYYIIEEIIEIAKWRLSYFKSFWNILDIVIIIIALCCIAFSIYRTVAIETKLQDLLNSPEQYANFGFISFAQSQFNDASAVMVFFAWVKIFKYISFNKTMNQLSATLNRSAKDVGGFAIMFFIFFFAYAQLGYLIFGTQIEDFSTFYDATFTLLRTILGDFDFQSLEQANRILGPIFFITYVFFVFFVLLNMFLAIINDTYAEVKAELATQKNEFEIADYFKRSYYNMLRKMNLKRDRIIDIQAALGASDIDANKQVEFDEWREHLKKRGYADAEIEAMFAKYDMDGDRILDEEEQNNMTRDLEDTTGGTNLDMDEPSTARSRYADFDGTSGYGSSGGDNGTRRQGYGGGAGVAPEEYNVLNRRVDRMEYSIGTVVAKIDAALEKLEALEIVKMRHREHVNKLIAESKAAVSDYAARKILTEGVTQEMSRFDADQVGE